MDDFDTFDDFDLKLADADEFPSRDDQEEEENQDDEALPFPKLLEAS